MNMEQMEDICSPEQTCPCDVDLKPGKSVKEDNAVASKQLESKGTIPGVSIEDLSSKKYVGGSTSEKGTIDLPTMAEIVQQASGAFGDRSTRPNVPDMPVEQPDTPPDQPRRTPDKVSPPSGAFRLLMEEWTYPDQTRERRFTEPGGYASLTQYDQHDTEEATFTISRGRLDISRADGSRVRYIEGSYGHYRHSRNSRGDITSESISRAEYQRNMQIYSRLIRR